MKIQMILPLLSSILLLVCPAVGAQNVDPSGVEHQRVAFVTTAAHSAIFGNWPEASMGLSGLEAADSICVNRASAAGLLAPGDFVAWLSDSTDDAYCRIHGLNGKKIDNCGEPSLPESAGPWVRTDGLPWAKSVVDLTIDNEVYTTLRMDENGDPVALNSLVWTGTSSLGFQTIGHCMDWTAAPIGENTAVGLVNRTGSYWSGNTTSLCTAPARHLYCLEKGAGPALNLQPATSRAAFVTLEQNSSNLGVWPSATQGTQGIEAADSICNNYAAALNLEDAGSYKAWISDDNTNARDRFVNDGPWFTPDGIPVAENLADLTDGEIIAPINQRFFSNHRVWTGTDEFGMRVMGANCGGWTGASGSGRAGLSDSITVNWTNWGNTTCAVGGVGHLFCLSDGGPEYEYADGFEN